MKAPIGNWEEAYDRCTAEGLIRPRDEVDLEHIRSLIDASEQRLMRIKGNDMQFEQKTKNYSFILCDYYEVMRMLIDAFLSFDKVSISNHQCSNAYLCVKHPELELSWELLESMRLLRNSVNYEGKAVHEGQWKKLKMPFDVYIPSLKKAIKQKLQHSK
jgi:hypothetical protein